MKRLTVVAVAASVAAAIAAAGPVLAQMQEISAKSADFLSKYEPTGKKETCVQLTQVDSIKALDERLLLIEMDNGTYYLNHPTSACYGADRANRRFELSTSEPRLCQGEILRVVDNSGGFLAGVCSLGEFEELTEKIANAPA